MFKDFLDEVPAPVENSTTALLDNLDLPLNYRNEQLCQFVENNPFGESLLDNSPTALNDFKNQFRLIRNSRSLENFETVLPTSAESDVDGELISIWRVIPKTIPANIGELFRDDRKSFVVKGNKIVRIMLEPYYKKGEQRLLSTLPSTMIVGSKGSNIVGSDTLNRIIHFEKDPRSQKGNLVEAWKELEAFNNFV
jgi:hypothetical protein